MRMSPGSIQEGFILTSLQESVGKRDFSAQLCGISVPLWWNYSEKINHRDTEIAQRSTEFIFPTDSFSQVRVASRSSIGNRLNVSAVWPGRDTRLKPGVNETANCSDAERHF